MTDVFFPVAAPSFNSVPSANTDTYKRGKLFQKFKALNVKRNHNISNCNSEACFSDDKGRNAGSNSDPNVVISQLFNNERGLHVLRVSPSLISLNIPHAAGGKEDTASLTLPQLLLRHRSLRSVIITEEAIRKLNNVFRGDAVQREVFFSELIEALFHLPLVSLFLGGLRLSRTEMLVVLELVVSLSGVRVLQYQRRLKDKRAGARCARQPGLAESANSTSTSFRDWGNVSEASFVHGDDNDDDVGAVFGDAANMESSIRANLNFINSQKGGAAGGKRGSVIFPGFTAAPVEALPAKPDAVMNSDINTLLPDASLLFNHLRYLELSGNSLGCDSNSRILGTIIFHPRCKIEKVFLDFCDLDDKSFAALVEPIVFFSDYKESAARATGRAAADGSDTDDEAGSASRTVKNDADDSAGDDPDLFYKNRENISKNLSLISVRNNHFTSASGNLLIHCQKYLQFFLFVDVDKTESTYANKTGCVFVNFSGNRLTKKQYEELSHYSVFIKEKERQMRLDAEAVVAGIATPDGVSSSPASSPPPATDSEDDADVDKQELRTAASGKRSQGVLDFILSSRRKSGGGNGVDRMNSLRALRLLRSVDARREGKGGGGDADSDSDSDSHSSSSESPRTLERKSTQPPDEMQGMLRATAQEAAGSPVKQKESLSGSEPQHAQKALDIVLAAARGNSAGGNGVDRMNSLSALRMISAASSSRGGETHTAEENPGAGGGAVSSVAAFAAEQMAMNRNFLALLCAESRKLESQLIREKLLENYNRSLPNGASAIHLGDPAAHLIPSMIRLEREARRRAEEESMHVIYNFPDGESEKFNFPFSIPQIKRTEETAAATASSRKKAKAKDSGDDDDDDDDDGDTDTENDHRAKKNEEKAKSSEGASLKDGVGAASLPPPVPLSAGDAIRQTAKTKVRLSDNFMHAGAAALQLLRDVQAEETIERMTKVKKGSRRMSYFID